MNRENCQVRLAFGLCGKPISFRNKFSTMPTRYIIGIGFLLLLSSCGAGDLYQKASVTANAFYGNLQHKDFPAAVSLCSKVGFDSVTKKEWIDMLKSDDVILGDIKLFKQVNGFNISAETGKGTRVRIAFDVDWQYGKSSDTLTLVRDDDGVMRVNGYRWRPISALYLNNLHTAELISQKYMAALKQNDPDAAVNLCSADALKITPREEWKKVLAKVAENGTLNNYTVITDSAMSRIHAPGSNGIGNYYDIPLRTQRGSTSMVEKVIFFQKDYDDSLRLIGYEYFTLPGAGDKK